MMAFLCSWLRHRLVEVQSFPTGSRKMKCTRCGGYYCLNERWEVFIPWLPLTEEFYAELTGARTIL